MPPFAAPASELALYAWLTILIVAYLGVAYTFCLLRCFAGARSWPTNRFFIQKLFDGVTFAGSLMLFLGIFDPVVLRLIGNTTLFLIIASLAGVGYSLHALFE
jgi:hypothetical protein